MNMRTRTRFRISILSLFVVIICCISDNNFIDPFDSQPKIVIKDGHLEFQTARNRNITFKSSGMGIISINGEDLAKIVASSKTAVNEMQRISSTQFADMSKNLTQLQSQYSNIASNVLEIRGLHSIFNDSYNKLNQILGTGTNALTPISVRRTIRKINRLEIRLNQLIQLLEKDECESNPCRNGGTCLDTYNGYHCRCTDGWQGTGCDTDVNECFQFVGTDLGCQNGGTCVNTPGGYSCRCPPDKHGIHCTEQFDDCFSASNEALCSHGTCINLPRVAAGQAKYRCICSQGWMSGGSNPACDQDVNECSSSQPHCSVNPLVACINTDGGFHCGPCPHGYTGNGFTCYDINECEINNGGCSQYPRVQCTNTIGSRICGACPPGYQGDGIYCNFVGTCHINNGGCHPMAQCLENTAISAGFRECRCPNGYIGSGVGQSGCIPQTGTTCSNNPCLHGSCSPHGDSFSCICSLGFTGRLCDIEINECLSNPCINGGTCTDQQNGFLCVCTNDYQGLTCDQPRETCGGAFNTEFGSIRYPINPNIHYPNRISCVWTVSTTSGKILNITFRSLNIENSADCSYDFLQINDGINDISARIGRFCGSNLPKGGNFVTTGNHIYLWFKSDHSQTNEGFELYWNTTDPVCGSELNVAEFGSVNSPGYPGEYPHDRDCYWLVRVPLGKRITFHFATLGLETHTDCSYDYLEVIDGQRQNDPSLGKFCSTITPPPITTSGSYSLIHFHSDGSMSGLGFHITYSSVPGIPGCGGTLTAPKASFASPNFPEQYSNNVECDWLIRTHPNERIQITFTVFELEHHSNCRYDYLEIREGENGESPLIGRFCGITIPPSVISTGNKVWVKFRADSSFTGQGFRAQYETVCGGLYTDLEATLRSPYFPDPYPSERRCLYHIVLPQSNLIRLTFDVFDIEGSIDCNFDYLEISDGYENGTKLGHLCGTALPDPITSRYNEMVLKFVTDASVNNYGFSANYTNIEVGCGGVYTTNHGSISTPNHPNFYPHTAQCFWLLNAPIGYIIRLTFTVFALESHSSCRYDYVEVRDTNNQVIRNKFCGQTLPPVLTSTGNQMFIEFKSDSSRAQEGFAAAFSFLDASTSCGGNFFLDSGVIRSPGYPNSNYPSERDCVWVLEARNGRQIALNVTHFELESGSDCRYDYLEIRNGRQSSSPLIGKFCGTRILRRIQSHGPFMYLRFKTDSSIRYSGFDITYDSLTTGCGGTLTTQSGSIESPGYPQTYGHNAECFWKIMVSKGSSILLTIVDIDIEAQSQCLFDFLEVFDGTSDRSLSLGRYCNNHATPHFIRSKDNVLFLKFRTDHSENGRGFRLNYQINCSNTVSGYRGVIESPNYPDNYGHNANCTWTIKAPLGNNISIAFHSLFIEDSANCQYDYIRVSELTEEQPQTVRELSRYCGTAVNQIPPIFNTSSNIAFINFVSDQSVSHMGFQLDWVSVGCGGEYYNKLNGMITSPNYPNGYPHNTECLWHIIMPPGFAIELTIIEFDLETIQGCYYDFIKIYGGIDKTSPLLLTLCQRITSPRIVTSMGSAITILFSSDNVVRGRGFKAWFEQKTGCGGVYTLDTFTITSPNYPKPYDAIDDCQYSIQVNGLHDIEFTFEEFGMPSSVNCTENYLEIYDGNTQENPLLIRHCGSSVPSPNIIRSTSNKAYLRMKADGSQTGKGFQLKYRAICGGTKLIESNQFGDITSPNYPNMATDNNICNWILKCSNLQDHITLRFTHINSQKLGECEGAYVEVRDGDDSEAPLINRFCGTAIPMPITSQGNSLYISSAQSIFRASFATTLSVCGGDFTSLEGYFASPDYPNSYPIDIECIWTISASPGNRVTFNFIQFDIEQSEFCNTDYVELRETNANGAYLGRFCGNQIPSLNITSSNVLWVKFRSDDQSTGAGFQAYYRLQHGIDLIGDSGRITSPGYPNEYSQQDDGSFTWTIIVSRFKFVSITFEDMSIPDPYSACNSYVQIIDGIGETAPEIGRYCGYAKPNPIVGNTNTLSVKYIPSMSGYSPGKFSLIYAAVNATEAANLSPINNIIDQNSNTSIEITLNRTSTYRITSPGYPTGYGNNLDYNWTIHCLPSYHLSVNVIDLLMDGHNASCWFDKLRFLVPEHRSSSLWRINKTLCGRFVGTFELPRVNLIRINFKTDYYYNRTGFDLIVSPVCGGVLYDSFGTLSTDDVLNSIHCEWTLIVRDGRTINITFEQFNIADNNHCQNSYVMLKNGQTSNSPNLGGGRYCGTNIPAIPSSSSNAVYIIFHANFHLHVDFRLRYKEVSVGCGDYLTITEANPSVEIMSPNYPQLPPHDMECDWIIRAPTDTSLRLEFDIPSNPTWRCNITSEYIEIRDGGTQISRLIDRYCVPPRGVGTIKSTGNLMLIRFVTSGSDIISNFKAKIEINDCGATYFVSSKFRLMLPYYPSNYTQNLNCDFYLKTYSDNYYYQLNISSLDMPAENNDCNRGDSIEIREPDSTGDLIGRYCGYSSNNTISVESTQSVVLITFKSNSDQFTGKGFVIDVSLSYSRCGGIIENAAATGLLTSPNFPNAVSSHRYCYWHLIAPPGRSIKLTFLDYNLKSNPRNSTICLDNLRIFRGVTYRATRIDIPCNSVIPDPIEIQSHYTYIYFRTTGLSPNEGFRLQYSAENEEQCGGSLSVNSGTIMSYRFGEMNYTDTMDCTWDISFMNGRNNYTVAFSFDVFEIPKYGNSSCFPHSFMISYLNPRYYQTYNYGRDYCGNLTRNGKNFEIFVQQSLSSSYAVYAFLTTNYSNGNRGIRGQYFVQECGGYFTNPDGEFVSPNYPNNYPHNSYCLWQFMVDWGELIRITFNEFNLGTNCEEDYVEIFQGFQADSPSSGKFCGSQKPPDIHSSTRYIVVAFKGKTVQTEALKFKMTVEKTQTGCGALLFHHFGTFQSPNYPNRYENNIECVWTIKMPVGYHVNFTFVDTFDIETTNDCINDYILFEESLSQDEDNWNPITKYCGHIRPESLQSKGNIVRVTFRTNQDIQGNGFKISYRKSCGEVFTSESGVFMSPNFPNNYDNSINCQYLIQRNASEFIYLEFESDFRVEPHPTCYWDALDIYLGNNKSATHLGPYCGDHKPLPLTSNAAILVTFKTDSYSTDRGFKAFYNITSCGGNLTQPNGEFHSPNHPTRYLHNMNCIWTITVEENRAIELSFIWIELESCWQCSCDFVEIRDGNNDTSNLLGRFCSSSRSDIPIIKSHGNQLWIRFRSDYSVTRSGFQLGYRTTLGEAQGCGGVYNNASNGVIQSPDIDNNGKYETDIDCQWTIIVAANQTVKLTFQEMDIEQSASNMTKCSYDYIEVRDGISNLSPVIDKYCGTTIPSPIIAATNKLTVSFHSDGRETRKGFKLAFESIDSVCGGYLNVTNITKTISSANYPNGYPQSLRCMWHFSMPRIWENRIHLAFTDLDIDCSNNDSLVFTSESGANRIEPFVMCGKIVPPMIMSDMGLRMTFISSSRPTINHRGFSLNYTISNCNMTFTFDSGFLHSTTYPYYSYEKFCQINITAEIGHTISLYFNNFQFNQYSLSSGCDKSNMTIRDGLLPSSPLIGTLCGSTLPEPIFSQSNQLSINITNYYQWNFKYFISYTTTNAGRGCGGNLTSFNALFTSPLYPQPYNQTGECKWFIHSLGLHTLTLRFSFFSLSSTLGCDTNYLEIYDGLEELSSNKIIRLCGNDEPSQYQSQGNVMTVKLVTNENNTAPGFKAHYTYNRIEINPSKQIMSSSLRPHIGRDNSYYYQTNGIMLRTTNNN